MSSQTPSIIFGQRVSPASDESTASDLQQLVGRILSILRHRHALFVLPMLTGMIVMLVVGLRTPRHYLVRTVLERRDDPVTAKLVSNSPYSMENSRKSLRYSVVGLDTVTKAVAALGLGKSDAQNKAIAIRVQPDLGAILLDTNQSFDLLELRYSGQDPVLGQKVLTSLKDTYIRETQDSVIRLQEQTRDFFEEQAEMRRKSVAKRQAELSNLLMEHPELDPARSDYLKSQLAAESLTIEQLIRSRTEINAEMQARNEYLRQLDDQQKQGKLPIEGVFQTQRAADPRRTQLETQILQVTNELNDAKVIRGMRDTHPYVETLNRKLTQLQAGLAHLPGIIAGQLAEGSEDTPWDRERQRTALEIKTFQSKLAQVEKDLASHETARRDLETQKSTVFDRQQAFTLRQQELNTLKNELNLWQNKLEEISRVLTATSQDRGTKFRTVEECRLPEQPVDPKLSTTFILSGGIGLALGIVSVFLREIFDRSFRNPARVRQVLGIPVLETIGELAVGSASRRFLRRGAFFSVVALQVLSVLVLGGLTYLSLQQPARYSRLAETMWSHLSPFLAWIG